MDQASPLLLTEAAQRAIRASKDHQYALKLYTERLEAELQTVDKLLKAADYLVQDDEPEFGGGGFILIPGSKKAVGPLSSAELTSPNSPFHCDAYSRSRFLEVTSAHPMKVKELEVLAEAVRTENLRREALNAQSRGQGLFDLQPPGPEIETNKEGLDWERIAERVSEVSFTPRTPQECRIRWLGDCHPQINHAPWSTEEISRLKTILSALPNSQINWVTVSKQLRTSRSPIDCMRHGLQRFNHIWTPESDNRLIKYVKIYGLDNWNLVARHVSEDATAIACQVRYYHTVDPSVKRGNWTSEEDEKLSRAVTVYGNNWAEISTMMPGRTNDQCRDRWSDCLNPSVVKGKWSSEEDERLLQAVEKLNGKWKEVSEQLGTGRTDNMCRLRYDVLMKRMTREVASPAGTEKQVRLNMKRKGKAKEIVGAADKNCEAPTNRPAGQRPKPKPRRDILTIEGQDQGTTEACLSVANQPAQALGTGEGDSVDQSSLHGCGDVVVGDPSSRTTEDVPSGGQENGQCSGSISTKRRKVDTTGLHAQREKGRSATTGVEVESSHDNPNVKVTLAHENQPTRSSLRLQRKREGFANK